MAQFASENVWVEWRELREKLTIGKNIISQGSWLIIIIIIFIKRLNYIYWNK